MLKTRANKWYSQANTWGIEFRTFILPGMFHLLLVQVREAELQWVASYLMFKGANVSHLLRFVLPGKSLTKIRGDRGNSGGAKRERCFFLLVHPNVQVSRAGTHPGLG